jgi:putative cell wall-binding protein
VNRRLVIAVAVFAAVTSVAATAGATTAVAGSRLAGPNRFATAQTIMEETFTEGAGVVLLVNGRSYADALSATYLAGVSGSPILLTEADELSDGVLDSLSALGATGVFVIGGEAAVSTAVVNEIQAAGYVTDRIAGENRYSTSRQVAELAGPDPIGSFGAGRAAIIVTGEGYADALAAGPVASAQGMPILLTTGSQLSPDAESALLSLQIDQVLIVGGTSAVSDDVFRRIFSLGIEVRRVAGADRMGTAVKLADLAKSELQFPTDRVLLARADNPADALVGGIRGGTVLAPILLVESVESLGDAPGAWLAENKATISSVEALGGTGVISQAVLDFAVAAARG